jgi:D-alanyl-D-alanine dipeptidase
MRLANEMSGAVVRLGLLLALCLGASAEPSNLVELVKVDPTLRLDIRYATPNNFLGFPVYPEARAFLQREAAEAVKAANQELRSQGLGLLILDAYRPHFVTQLMWDRTPESKRAYVADPAQGSRHNRGAAVDLTIIDLATGRPLKMPSMYDDFSEKAHHDYQLASAEALANRARLRALMEKHGFQALSNEWWHYDFKGWEKYPISNQSFRELEQP